MDNIIDYVKQNGNYSFDEEPINHVDQMVLAMISYNTLEDFYSPNDTLSSVSNRAVEKGFTSAFYRDKKDVELMVTASFTKRFGELKIYNPVGIITDINSDEKTQFGAMTFYDDKRAIVCYRGTDLSFVGWKEDMNMSLMKSVPADIKGLEYLEKAYNHFKDKEIYVTGQSKGGHVSVYSFLNARNEIKDRIVACYNFDGPGFASIDSNAFLDEKIHTIIPETSIVGMLLCHSEKYTVVKSKAYLIMQHDPYSWYVKGRDFEYTKRSITSVYLDKVTHKWLQGITDEKRERFIDAFFDILSSADTSSFRGYAQSVIKNFPKVTKKINTLNSEDKEVLSFMLKKFGEALFEELKETNTLALENKNKD